MASGDTQIAVAVSLSTLSKWGVGGINKNWLEVGEAKSTAAVAREHDDRTRVGVGGTYRLWFTSSCVSLNVKHDDEIGVGRESGVIGRVKSVLKGQYSVGGTTIRSGGGFLAKRVAELPEQEGEEGLCNSSSESPSRGPR